MKVKVDYFAFIREITKLEGETIECPGNVSALDFLGLLALKHGQKFRDYMFDSCTGKPRPLAVIPGE